MSNDAGTLTVITGPMFAGKTEDLILRLKRGSYRKQKVVALKPAIDDRYHGTDIASHEGLTFKAISVKSAREIPTLPEMTSATLVGIDEAQFFDESIIEVCQTLISEGKSVFVVGLDTDYQGKPFGPIPALMAIANKVIKLTAGCTICGGEATRTQRIVNSQDQVVVGGSSAYTARCQKHWSPEPVFARREASDG